MASAAAVAAARSLAMFQIAANSFSAAGFHTTVYFMNREVP